VLFVVRALSSGEAGRRTTPDAMHDLAIIIISTNEAHWLRPCLRTIFEHTGAISVDVVVADNESTDGTRELVETEFPRARVVTCKNRGFSHANNRGIMATDSRYVLFLNPDTEILAGTFEELVRALDARANIGLVGVRQVSPDGALYPTIRFFPNAIRVLGDALGSERVPLRASWLGERELRMDRYDQDIECDWTSGSFMLARREALESAGYMDERSFIYSEEPDLCLRMKKTGWQIRHLPTMTILHHTETSRVTDRIVSQNSYSRLLYAEKHFSAMHRRAHFGALLLRHALRSFAVSGPEKAAKRAANRAALRTLVGRHAPPYGAPPGQAVAIRAVDGASQNGDARSTAARVSSRAG
jgi:N-acetylglucosaminyl-diphospho-decaprenol L-rhamnosyltransferase